MADEILRYNRIRAFMFDRTIFPLINVKYNLREDEIILSHTMLSEDYLDNLEPVPENEYANFNTYDTAEPLLSELYESMHDAPSSQHVKCTTEKIFLTQEYRKYFSSKQTQQLEMLKFNSNSPRCSFEVILFILRLEAKRRNLRLANRELPSDLDALRDVEFRSPISTNGRLYRNGNLPESLSLSSVVLQS